MNRPDEVVQLLTDLEAEKPDSAILITKDSKMVMTFEGRTDRFEFTGPECQLLLSSRKNVDRLFDALDYPDETFIELHSVEGLDPYVMETLEEWAETVDEM